MKTTIFTYASSNLFLQYISTVRHSNMIHIRISRFYERPKCPPCDDPCEDTSKISDHSRLCFILFHLNASYHTCLFPYFLICLYVSVGHRTRATLSYFNLLYFLFNSVTSDALSCLLLYGCTAVQRNVEIFKPYAHVYLNATI